MIVIVTMLSLLWSGFPISKHLCLKIERSLLTHSDISVTTDDYTRGSLLDFAITEKGVIVCVF